MPKFHSPAVHLLAPWAVAIVAALLLAWVPAAFADDTSVAPASPIAAPMGASPVHPVHPAVAQQADLTVRRNVMTQGMNTQYDREVQRTSEVIAPLQEQLLAQFAKARTALDTARIQITSGDATQRTNATHTVDNVRQLLTRSSQQAQWATDRLQQEVKLALDASNGTMKAAQMMDQGMGTPTANTLASQAALVASKKRMDGLPAFVNGHVQAFQGVVTVQQQDLQKRLDAIVKLLATSKVY